MANYAEQLAYWYLRLNGFFLVSNYVYHQIQEDEKARAYNADADLLAIRPPYYFEEISHREKDQQGRWHYLHAPLDSDGWFAEFQTRWIGAIVEVKGSDEANINQVKRAFTKGRLRISLNRLGLTYRMEDGVKDLLRKGWFDYGEGIIFKIVFSQRPLDGHWKNILLDEADEFIIDRMTDAHNYLAKTGSRYFFPSELIQYMIWSNNRPNRRERRPFPAGF